MAFSGADHLVISVRDIDQGIDTWQNKLGLTLSHKIDLPEVGICQAFFLLEDDTFIELIAPMSDSSPIAKTLESRGEGVHTVALKVDDIDVAIEHLASQGVQLIGVGSPQVFIHPKSANGVRIQLWPKTQPHRWKEQPNNRGSG
jgi:methylmalonyl-CoA epimerase